jgi:tetratricopeptide (TPR) repeat protein
MKRRILLISTGSVLLLTMLMSLIMVPGISSQGPQATPELNGESAQDYLERGTVFANTIFDTAGALSDLSTAIELDPTLAAALVERGKLYHSIDAFDLALADFENALELNPDSEGALLGRARYHIALARRTNIDKAQADIDHVVELNPESVEAIIAQGELYEAQDLYDAAFEQYSQAVNAEPENLIALERRVNAGALMSTTPPSFVPDLEAFLAQAAETPSVYGWQTYDHYRRTGVSRTMGPCNEGIVRFPSDALLFNNCAFIAAGAEGSLEQALSFAERAIELAPISPRFHTTRAILLGQAFRTDEAVAELEKALELQPRYVPATNEFLQIYLYSPRTQDCELAEVYVTMAHESYPETVNEANNLNNLSYDLSFRCAGDEEVSVYAVDNPAYPDGSSIVIPGVIIYQLGSSAGELSGGPACTSGTDATVLRSVTLEPESGAVWLELECESGTGWMPQSVLE